MVISAFNNPSVCVCVYTSLHFPHNPLRCPSIVCSCMSENLRITDKDYCYLHNLYVAFLWLLMHHVMRQYPCPFLIQMCSHLWTNTTELSRRRTERWRSGRYRICQSYSVIVVVVGCCYTVAALIIKVVSFISQNIEKEQQEGINEETKHLEKLANKRSLLLNKVCNFLVWFLVKLCCYHLIYLVMSLQKEDSMRKIRELGSLPTDAFEKYMSLTLSQVRSVLYLIIMT